jgi:hypothetical protein
MKMEFMFRLIKASFIFVLDCAGILLGFVGNLFGGNGEYRETDADEIIDGHVYVVENDERVLVRRSEVKYGEIIEG